MDGAGDRQQLEIAEMGGEEDMRPLLRGDLQEAFLADDLDAPGLAIVRIEVEQRVEENVLGGESRHVVPHVERDLFDLLVVLLGKGMAQIVDGGAVAPEQGTDAARDAGGEIQRLVGRQPPEQPQGHHRETRDDPVVEQPQAGDDVPPQDELDARVLLARQSPGRP